VTDGFELEVITVVVEALFTTWVSAEDVEAR
jgi:hypothetical protein